jgi:RHH-type rel operon transcriptional repressor/antitoxin RelB
MKRMGSRVRCYMQPVPSVDRAAGAILCTFDYIARDPMSTTMTVRLDDELKERLEGLAEATQRTKSFLATEAIREYLDLNEWQIQETRAALAEADAGDFASDDEIRAVTTKWNADAG